MAQFPLEAPWHAVHQLAQPGVPVGEPGAHFGQLAFGRARLRREVVGPQEDEVELRAGFERVENRVAGGSHPVVCLAAGDEGVDGGGVEGPELRGGEGAAVGEVACFGGGVGGFVEEEGAERRPEA